MQRSTLGILLCMGSMLSFAVQDIITKIILTGGIPLGQLLTVRYASFALFAVIAAGGVAGTLQALRSSAPKMQIGRASLSMLEIALINFSFVLMPVAKAHSIVALFPLIALVMAWFILKEQFKPAHLVAVLLGFAGTLFIVRPTDAGFDADLLYPLAGATALASYAIASKYLSARDKMRTHLVYLGLVGFLIALPFGIANWQSTSLQQWGLLALVSLMNIASQLLFIRAMDFADAATLQPFNYTLLLFATLAALLILQEVPSSHTLIGGALIVVGGLITMIKRPKVAGKLA